MRKNILIALIVFFAASGSVCAETRTLSARERQDLLDEEARRVRALLEANPSANEREDLLIHLAALERSRGAVEDAIAALEKVRGLEEFPTSRNRKRVLSDLGNLYESFGDLEAAVEAYRACLDGATGEVSSATETAEPSLPADPAMDVFIEQRYLNALIDVGRYDEAGKRILSNIQAKDLGRASYAAMLLVSLYSQGHVGERDIGSIADVLIRRFPTQAFRLARAMEERGEDEGAGQFYSRLLDTSPASVLPNADALAAFYQRTGGIDRVVSDLEGKKESSEAYSLLLIRFYRAVGRSNDAASVLAQWLEKKETPALLAELGDLYMAAGEYPKAVETYRRLSELSPLGTDAWERLGEAYFKAGSSTEAVQAWQKIPLQMGNSAAAWADLSEIYERHGFTDQAVAAMRKAAELYPGLSYYNSRLLNLMIHNERYGEAATLLAGQIAESPQFESIFVQDLADEPISDEAREGLIAALRPRIQTASVMAREPLARILFEIRIAMGRYQEAIEEVAAIPSPQRDLALYQLGGVLANQGEMEYARQAFRSVGRDSLYYVGSRLTAMDVSLAMGDPAGAREFGREALESVLTNSSVAGFIASATANLAEALKESRKILGTLPLLQQHSEYSAALYLLAKAAADLKDGGAALELLKASEDLPGGRRARPGTLDVEAEILRGEAYALLGDRSAARDRLTKASGAWAGPTADEARFLLADITLWDGNTEAAVAEYGALASGEPSSPIVNDALERIHVLSQLQPDVVPLYARAADFEWRGRYDDAVEEYRNLAARTVGSYVADWALYRVGRILFRTGKVEDAEKTWQVVAERTEDSLLKGRIAFETIERIEKTPGVSREEIDGRYRKLIEEMPDTIFADRARKRISS